MQGVKTLADSPTAPAHDGYRISLEPEPHRIQAAFQGEIVADSRAVLVIHETRLAPVFYFPRYDVRVDLMVKSDRRTHCPFKDNASCWTVRIGDRPANDAAWSYETAYDESSRVEGYIAFDWQAMDGWVADGTTIAEQPRDKADAKENSLVSWLVHDACMSKLSRDLVMRFSDAMIEAGFPLWRNRLLVRTLNPLLFTLVYT